MTDLSHDVSATIDVPAGAYLSNGELRMPLALIQRNPTIDPRKQRNKRKYEEMSASIRKDGVLMPILVRPVTGAEVPYEVVAGNTRFDISGDVGHSDIPVRVVQMTDAEARTAAAIENMKRADLTPIEEAHHCVSLLADHANDHEEVCRILGWSRQQLDSRVLLSHACDEVAEALVQDQIKLGHAMLLVPMSPEDQRSVCAKIIERNMTVAETKKRLEEMTFDISAARFDTAECSTCVHNSGRYVDMFSTSLAGAKCQKRTCWEEKTQQLISVRLIEAEGEYGVVHTDLTLPKDGYVLLEETGPNGVGAQQVTACLSCKNYGAVVSTKPGQEGHIVGGHCFDLKCNKERKAAYKELIAQANGAGQAVQENTAGGGAGTAGGAKGAAPGQSKEAGKASPKVEAKPQELKRAIRREAFNLYAQMGAEAIKNDRRFVLAISIVSLYLDMRSDLPNELDGKIRKAMDVPASLGGYNRAAFEEELAKRPVEQLESFLTQLAACSVHRKDSSDQFQKSIAGSQSLSVIKASGMNPVDHFKMTEAYLKSLTKPMVIADCKASGFDKKYDEVKGDKAFTKLAGGKADELIKGILDFTEFSWKGFLPDVMKIEAHDGSGTAA